MSTPESSISGLTLLRWNKKLLLPQPTSRSFAPSFNYFLKVGSDIKSVGLNKKKVLAALNNAEIDQFVKKNKIKFKSEAELVEVIAHYAELEASSTATAPIASVGN